MLEILFVIALPLLIAIAAAVVSWNALASPWRFLVVAVIALYAVYFVAIHFFGPSSVGFALYGLKPGEPKPEEPTLPFIQAYTTPLLVFAALAIPTVFALLRTFKR